MIIMIIIIIIIITIDSDNNSIIFIKKSYAVWINILQSYACSIY